MEVVVFLCDQTTVRVLDIGHNLFILFQKLKTITTLDPPGQVVTKQLVIVVRVVPFKN